MKLVNRTRHSASIAKRLLREKPYLIPLYYLIRTSYLGKEGMEHSGSYHFADHVYGDQPQGTLGIGKLLDRVLLRLPAARSFRNRYLHSRDRILQEILDSHPCDCSVLSVPCGLPRDLAEVAARLDTETLERTKFFGIDADPAALREARDWIGHLPQFELICGDALAAASFPSGVDIITSSGFAEFLEDDELLRFYRHCHRALRPGGVLITSATTRNRFTEFLMIELAELRTHYRDEAVLAPIFAEIPFRKPEFRRDPVGYQILITARKEPC